MSEQSMSERMCEAFGDIDMKAALRLAFNKCPNCGTPMHAGTWLRWCPKKRTRECEGYVGPIQRKQRLDEQREIIEAMDADRYQRLIDEMLAEEDAHAS